MAWKVEITIPSLGVPDLGTAIGFYERLGAVVDWTWPEDAPTHAGLLLGGASLMFVTCDSPGKGDIYFIVDDVDACHAGILAGRCWELASGVEGAPENARKAPPPPGETDYGLRDFSLLDPWGHHLSFGTPRDGS